MPVAPSTVRVLSRHHHQEHCLPAPKQFCTKHHDSSPHHCGASTWLSCHRHHLPSSTRSERHQTSEVDADPSSVFDVLSLACGGVSRCRRFTGQLVIAWWPSRRTVPCAEGEKLSQGLPDRLFLQSRSTPSLQRGGPLRQQAMPSLRWMTQSLRPRGVFSRAVHPCLVVRFGAK